MCSETDQLSLSIVSNFSTTIPIDESKVTIKTPLEFDETVEPDDVNGLEVCASLRLLPTYMNNLDNYNSDNVLKWQYYGGQNSAIFSICTSPTSGFSSRAFGALSLFVRGRPGPWTRTKLLLFWFLSSGVFLEVSHTHTCLYLRSLSHFFF